MKPAPAGYGAPMRSLILSLLLLLAALPASATQIAVRTGTCPLGGGPVKIYDEVSASTVGGMDSDLATYTAGGQFRAYAIATCPDNLFSLYGKDMGVRFDEAVARELRAELARARAELSDLDDPPVWERYGIAARMYRVLGKDPLFIAQVYVEASWTARDEAVGVFRGVKGPPGIVGLLRQGEAELAGDLDPAKRRTLLFNLARLAERGGYPALRDRYIDEFARSGPLDAEEQAALDRFRRMTTEIEPRYQDLAIAELREGLRREGLDRDDKIRATYLLADLLRRRGHDEEALGLYSLVAAEPGAPPDLRELALFLARQLAGDDPVLPAGDGDAGSR